MRYPQIDVIFLVDADDEDEVIQRIQFVYLDKFEDVQIQSLHLDDLSTYPGPMPIQTIGMIWNNTQSDLIGTMASSIIVTSTSTMVVAVSEQTGSAFSETISRKIKICGGFRDPPKTTNIRDFLMRSPYTKTKKSSFVLII